MRRAKGKRDAGGNRTVYFRDSKTAADLERLHRTSSLSINLIINIVLERHLPAYVRKPGELLSQTRR